MDEHEFLITPQGDAYFIALKAVKANLTAYGGPKNGAYEDPEIMEVNLRTGKLIFTWNMAAHVPLSDSIVSAPTTPGQPWDAYHVNSIDVSPDGSQFLVSARNTWGIYDISRKTGRVLWQIGGKQNQFSLPSDLITGPYDSAFQYQHDAHYVPGGISLFDDGGLGLPPNGGPYGTGRGLILNLDLQNHTASLESPPYYHDPALYPNSLGNLQVLGNGNVLIGWGSDTQAGGASSSYYTEYSSSGSVLADFVLAGQDLSYRAQPSVGGGSAHGAVGGGHRCERASDRVRILERLDRDGRLGVARRPRADVAVAGFDHIAHGFETAIATTAAGPFYQVEAIGAGGVVLDKSTVIRAHS